MIGEKYDAELDYWSNRFQIEGALGNRHYEELMLNLSGKSKEWFAGKIVGDFGCGPRGSLEWLDNARARYCIDVLVDDYEKFGIGAHEATYVRSTEDEIPLATGALDALFSINAIDHVADINRMVDECFRILRPGGHMFFSVNLDEPPSEAEPNTITMADCERLFFRRAEVYSSVTSNRSKGNNKYTYLYSWAENGTPPPIYNGAWGMLWFRGMKT